MFAKTLHMVFSFQVRACLNAAYSMYLDEIGYKNQDVYRFSEKDVVNHFMTRWVDDYMKKAFAAKWFKILFMPWTIIASPELYEYRLSSG